MSADRRSIAHLTHGIKRVVIFDIDLHYGMLIRPSWDYDHDYDKGNGTQSIVWQINEETYRQTLETEEGKPNPEIGLRIFYGSIHDILSYPCEVRSSLNSRLYYQRSLGW